jgi:hypothetical protein
MKIGRVGSTIHENAIKEDSLTSTFHLLLPLGEQL